MSEFHSPFIAAVRLLGFISWTLLMVPPYLLLLCLGKRGIPLFHRYTRYYWKGVAWIIGFTIEVRGKPTEDAPALFVANHASYLDIVVLGTLINGVFIAKREVGTWPGIGFLAKIGRTVFIERRAQRSAEQREQMLGRLGNMGESLILFPEGTSNDGNRVLPFKSALLSVAETPRADGKRLPVQPVTVSYTRIDGLPIGWGWRSFWSWYGDMDLAPHLWILLGLGTTTIEVDFHEPVSLEQFKTRKALTDHCHDVVSRRLVQANMGRVPEPVSVG